MEISNMTVMTRAKMRLDYITNMFGTDNRIIRFTGVCDDSTEENRRFSKYTPSGYFEIHCNNPTVLKNLELGKYYYFDIYEAS